MEKKKHTHRVLKIFGIIASALVVIAVGGFLLLATHTQIVVGVLQKMSDNGKPLNSYEPLNEPYEGIKENGQFLISEINYGSDYPNSYLDIVYPNENLEENRPTLFYFHGGGFFAGSKNMGDPLASSEATYLIDDICAQGYNIVNVDYVLVPEGHFPDPLIQVNQAFSFVMEHGEEYHLDTDNIILMGSSAGAIIVAQMATAISNDEYAELLGISPILNTDQICAVVIDDGPLDYESFTLGCKVLIGNYVKGSIFLNKDELNRYDCIPHMTKDYPDAFLLGSEYRYDMNEMHDKLNELNVENILIDPYAENGKEKPHCFVSSERVDPIAKDAFDRMMEYLNEKSE
ncbi:MAG: alpha/beta hydrolase [Spirochaetales bacterium]|nr:alpha/beta hydrolase [Spirochaetales bacterium]